MGERDWAAIVRQLRAKADSTSYPEEASALRARADMLAERYGLSRDTDRDDEERAELERLIAQAERDWEQQVVQWAEYQRSRFAQWADHQRATQRANQEERRRAAEYGTTSVWGTGFESTTTSGLWDEVQVTIRFGG